MGIVAAEVGAVNGLLATAAGVLRGVHVTRECLEAGRLCWGRVKHCQQPMSRKPERYQALPPAISTRCACGDTSPISHTPTDVCTDTCTDTEGARRACGRIMARCEGRAGGGASALRGGAALGSPVRGWRWRWHWTCLRRSLPPYAARFSPGWGAWFGGTLFVSSQWLNSMQHAMRTRTRPLVAADRCSPRATVRLPLHGTSDMPWPHSRHTSGHVSISDACWGMHSAGQQPNAATSQRNDTCACTSGTLVVL